MPQKWPHLKQYGFFRNTQEKINRANALDSGQLIWMMKWIGIQISLTGLTSVQYEIQNPSNPEPQKSKLPKGNGVQLAPWRRFDFINHVHIIKKTGIWHKLHLWKRNVRGKDRAIQLLQEKKVCELTVKLKKSSSERTQVRTHFTKQRLNEPNSKDYGQECSIDYQWMKFL